MSEKRNCKPLHLGLYYGLNVHEILKSIYQNPNPYCGCIWRWELWEVIRFRRGQESEAPPGHTHKGIRELKTGDTGGKHLFLSPLFEDTQQSGSATSKESLHQNLTVLNP